MFLDKRKSKINSTNNFPKKNDHPFSKDLNILSTYLAMRHIDSFETIYKSSNSQGFCENGD